MYHFSFYSVKCSPCARLFQIKGLFLITSYKFYLNLGQLHFGSKGPKWNCKCMSPPIQISENSIQYFSIWKHRDGRTNTASNYLLFSRPSAMNEPNSSVHAGLLMRKDSWNKTKKLKKCWWTRSKLRIMFSELQDSKTQETTTLRNVNNGVFHFSFIAIDFQIQYKLSQFADKHLKYLNLTKLLTKIRHRIGCLLLPKP
jgi:hypothetical protein